MQISSLGTAIRRYRKVAGLTQAELGEKTGFDPKTISRFETGAYIPSIEALCLLATVLQVQMKAFFTDMSDEDEQRAYLFDVIHKATPQDLGKLIAAVDQALSKP
ncbi:helix-turn-helix transcriptional regulator [Pseudomonas sp. RGM2987]|uniref:helix-turn-helix domain-containing protein n=1 Tax=Pseudomonas sp. RGM2987 TaxID=2930090 RepID=UPI001FD69B1A|nr:helix-turn-helix transcriptional regulator [Pseudomonas sp. RGM2987]MCJ8204571.1 helix-turn-helix domain-containing protein [Pseudomonas sp. RGM2987]